LNDTYIAETAYRENADKKPQVLPDTHKYDFITDVANNVQLSVGWTWKKARELDTHSQKNNYVEIANNQLTSIGWIPQNNYDKDGEGRQLAETEKTNYYLDVKDNGLLNIGWKPKDDARTLSTDDSTNLYIDVKNNYSTTANNNYYLAVGVGHKDERTKADEDSRSLFIDVAGNMTTFVGADSATQINGNNRHKTLGNSRLTVEYSYDVKAMALNIATLTGTKFKSDVTVGTATEKYNLFVNGSLGTSVGASDTFTTPSGRTVTVKNGIVTSIV
jgi:hypothetical protein